VEIKMLKCFKNVFVAQAAAYFLQVFLNKIPFVLPRLF